MIERENADNYNKEFSFLRVSKAVKAVNCVNKIGRWAQQRKFKAQAQL